jgi:hypothetical protein
MRRLLPLALVVLLLPARVDAVTIRDIVDLTKAGLGDEILLALIEVDGSVFRIDPETLTMLKREGVSERVILAMVRSGRMRPAEEPLPSPPVEVAEAPAPQPPLVVIEHRDRDVPVPFAVPVPVYVPVYPRHDRFRDFAPGDRRADFIPDRERERARPAEPVYWGFGGKLRPDAWKPSPNHGERKERDR